MAVTAGTSGRRLGRIRVPRIGLLESPPRRRGGQSVHHMMYASNAATTDGVGGHGRSVGVQWQSYSQIWQAIPAAIRGRQPVVIPSNARNSLGSLPAVRPGDTAR